MELTVLLIKVVSFWFWREVIEILEFFQITLLNLHLFLWVLSGSLLYYYQRRDVFLHLLQIEKYYIYSESIIKENYRLELKIILLWDFRYVILLQNVISKKLHIVCIFFNMNLRFKQLKILYIRALR